MNIIFEQELKITRSFCYAFRSNCERKSINRLKEHITLPGFLPKLSDKKQTLWIFMGTPGHGAPMHVSDDKIYLHSTYVHPSDNDKPLVLY